MDSLIIFGAKDLIFIVILLSLWYGLSSAETRWPYLKQLIWGGIVAMILAYIAGKLYINPRPFVTDGVTPLVAHGATNGFPSEHTLVSFVFAFSLYAYRKTASYWLMLLALLVGISRVAAGVHHPIDIVGGIVLAGIAVWATRQRPASA